VSSESSAKNRGLGASLAFAAALGMLGGLGGYAFRYAEGFSYLSTDPKACVNCHIMQPEYDGWQKASHHTAAVCVDCHLPQEFVPKYFTKFENGYRHGRLFTTQTFHEPIEVGEAGRAILQNNCIRCHEGLTANMAGSHDTSIPCVKCHSSVGHGTKFGLGGPLRAEETSNGP
jgi:cytochrome c nitrite reductase small subunit